MPERTERSMNIGDNSLPQKLALVSPDGQPPKKPMKTGCLTDSRAEPLNSAVHNDGTLCPIAYGGSPLPDRSAPRSRFNSENKYLATGVSEPVGDRLGPTIHGKWPLVSLGGAHWPESTCPSCPAFANSRFALSTATTSSANVCAREPWMHRGFNGYWLQWTQERRNNPAFGAASAEFMMRYYVYRATRLLETASPVGFSAGSRRLGTLDCCRLVDVSRVLATHSTRSLPRCRPQPGRPD